MNFHQYAETHEVFNQVPPLEGTNLYSHDRPLQDWLKRYGAAWAEPQLQHYGALAGGPLMAAGFLANENKPVFKSHDRYGHRIDLVEFHPAYHELMRTAVEHGLVSLPWAGTQQAAQVARAGLYYLHAQAEIGSGCPLTMTFASVPALRLQPELADLWLPKMTSDASSHGPLRVSSTSEMRCTSTATRTERRSACWISGLANQAFVSTATSAPRARRQNVSAG